MLSDVQLSCFFLSYLTALGFEVFATLRRSIAARWIAIGLTFAGLVAHTAYLAIRSREANLPPLLSSTQDWVLVLAWLAVVLYLAILALDKNLPLGLFLHPVVIGLIIVALVSTNDPHSLVAGEALPLATRRWTMLHAAALVAGSGGVLLGFVLSIMYLIQHRRLREKVGTSPAMTLPNLEKLATLNWWSVVVAVPLLTMGLLAGVILGRVSSESTDTFSFSDPVVIAHAVVWIVMAALFFRLLRRREASGKTVAWQTIWAFGFLIATIVGLELLTGDGKLDSFHSQRSQQQSPGEPA
jgi:ABC-type transport system involved in cytochrome c biogenesis permease subunit